MATLRQVGIAEQLIREIPRKNNQVRGGVKELLGIRASFDALSQADRDAVLSVINERGYDISEYDAMLTAWAAVDTAMEAEGITKKDVPR